MQIKFEIRVALVCTAEEWIDCPDHVVIMHGGRTFQAQINARALEYGVWAY